MKVIGLIGGMSWHSSVEYYKLINELVAQRLGGSHSARLILYSLDFDEMERAQGEGRWNDAATALGEAGSALKEAGAEFLVLCTNTMHKVADMVAERSGLPLLHITDVIGKEISERGLGIVGLLGTRFTMEDRFYRGGLEGRFGLRVLVPKEKDRDSVHRIIYDELCKGRIEAASRRACVEVISKMVRRGAQAIVLGCTELTLLITPDDVDMPLFDTTRLHVEAAVNLALSE